MDGEARLTQADQKQRHPVLQVFGIELQVSNPRLAELLTMDAKDALTTDLHDLGTPEGVAQAEAEAAEAVPDVLLAPHLGRDDEEARRRQAFRQEVHDIGVQLGFSAGADGLWRSAAGLVILTRSVDKPLSFAAATHFVDELAARREAIAGPDATTLFVVDSQQAADVFKVAVRQRRLHDVMRTVSIDNLREIRDLHTSGALDHRQALVLLVPVANIDVGELLSILHSAGCEPPRAA